METTTERNERIVRRNRMRMWIGILFIILSLPLGALIPNSVVAFVVTIASALMGIGLLTWSLIEAILRTIHYYWTKFRGRQSTTE